MSNGWDVRAANTTGRDKDLDGEKQEETQQGRRERMRQEWKYGIRVAERYRIRDV